jgi:NodT family efflux transporter outer membrane factor (OMF) lipoprotein
MPVPAGKRGWQACLEPFGALAILLACGCTVGPDFVPPTAPTGDRWIEAQEPSVRTEPAVNERWWNTFKDPVLSRLVASAYKQNLSLRAAGLRVLQAQARRAVAIGDLFPQRQQLTGGYTRDQRSSNAPLSSIGPRSLNTWRAGFDTVWELDLWGKFRRAIEATDADLLASVASYDDVLVSLIGEVAATYVRVRVLDERLAVARDNVRVQQNSLEIARVRFEAGGTSELDVQQATTLLKDTEATIPRLEIERRQAIDSLCVLLGLPPNELTQELAGTARVPQVPAIVAVGIPADLLRRRPDVRRAEWAAAAQSAQIGVATADLLPSFQLAGSIGLRADSVANLFQGRAFEGSTGPSFDWPILNYGRLVNNVRLQDATFQELVISYANTVLTAQQEVEDALTGYLRGNEQVSRLAESVKAAERAVELSFVQYREGATDFTAVLNTQQSKLREGDLLASTRGEVALSVIALNKSLGGGWEIRDGEDFIPSETRDELRARTYWGTLLSPETRARDVDAAGAESKSPRERGWRWWWPEW